MRAPLSWIKEFVEIPSGISAEQIAEGLIRVGFEVEEVIETGAGLTGPLKFAKVLSIEEITEFTQTIVSSQLVKLKTKIPFFYFEVFWQQAKVIIRK